MKLLRLLCGYINLRARMGVDQSLLLARCSMVIVALEKRVPQASMLMLLAPHPRLLSGRDAREACLTASRSGNAWGSKAHALKSLSGSLMTWRLFGRVRFSTLSRFECVPL